MAGLKEALATSVDDSCVISRIVDGKPVFAGFDALGAFWHPTFGMAVIFSQEGAKRVIGKLEEKYYPVGELQIRKITLSDPI